MAEQSRHELEHKLNWLRAAVLGANDGMISIAGVVMGIAGAGADRATVALAGIAALAAGAISMAGGEYTSVSAQRDAEIAYGRHHLEIAASPWTAAWASFVAFTSGGLLPLLAVLGPWQENRVPVTVVAVVVALGLTGWWAADRGGASRRKSILRNVIVSVLTMVISYSIGVLLGVTVFA
ncbi:VIT1/CCC1 transporter family protein [Aquiluna sp. KACHI24]|uniref:VIT1/CCC1 transporter family protein n=1 Tax=Aquiluna sp. KACHI24 TaxID=2968831 RepID=UPI0021FA5DE7|nr:VIT1/CCC1 transporter family protein [Aquiluna sp. KACHI24]BDQ00331.1 membrane protein [Aquiluna sp. KACHI24]